MIEKHTAMSIARAGGLPDPSRFYEAPFAKDAPRNAGRVELPGFRNGPPITPKFNEIWLAA